MEQPHPVCQNCHANMTMTSAGLPDTLACGCEVGAPAGAHHFQGGEPDLVLHLYENPYAENQQALLQYKPPSCSTPLHSDQASWTQRTSTYYVVTYAVKPSKSQCDILGFARGVYRRKYSISVLLLVSEHSDSASRDVMVTSGSLHFEKPPPYNHMTSASGHMTTSDVSNRLSPCNEESPMIMK